MTVRDSIVIGFHFAVPVALTMIVALIGVIADAGSAAAQAKAPCKEMRKVKLGVSVSPPNVVHTPIYVARDLGIFESHCIEAEIVEFEGGASAANSGRGHPRPSHGVDKCHRHLAGTESETDLGHGATSATSLHG